MSNHIFTVYGEVPELVEKKTKENQQQQHGTTTQRTMAARNESSWDMTATIGPNRRKCQCCVFFTVRAKAVGFVFGPYRGRRMITTEPVGGSTP